MQGKEKQLALNTGSIDHFKEYMQTANFQETAVFLSEQDFKLNVSKVFPEAPEFFGKLLYLYMANGFDRAKISLYRYCESLIPLVNTELRF